MTRKHFIRLAAALASTRPDIEDFTRHSAVGDNTMVDTISFNAASRGWTAARDAVADGLRGTNPNYDRERFIAATEGPVR